MSNFIPNSWVACKFGDIVQIKNGFAFKSTAYKKSKGVENDIPLVRQSQLKGSVVDLSEAVYLDNSYLLDCADYVIEKGDIIIGMSGSIGKVCEYRYDYPAMQNQRTGKIKPFLKNELNSKFFGLFLSNVERLLSEHAKGMGIQNISAKDIENLNFNLPPLHEQHRIVVKVETLFSELDKGIESFKTAREQLKIYRQALLKHAFSGKLTAQWRAENQEKLETAEVLLQRIQTEREQRYQQQLNDWEATGKQGRKPNVPKTLPPLTAEELAELPELPKGWAWGKLGWTTCSVEYGTSAKSSEHGTFPVLRMGNIQNGKFDWSDLVFTSDENEIEKYLLRNGDVLFNRTNSPELVGKSAIYKPERPAIFAGYLIRVNQIKTIANGQFLNLFLNSHIAKQHGNKVKTDGVNQSNINGVKLTNYPFPFCSIDEQSIIVDLLESRLSITDQLDQTLTTALQ